MRIRSIGHCDPILWVLEIFGQFWDDGDFWEYLISGPCKRRGQKKLRNVIQMPQLLTKFDTSKLYEVDGSPQPKQTSNKTICPVLFLCLF